MSDRGDSPYNEKQEALKNFFTDMLIDKQPSIMAEYQRWDELESVFGKMNQATDIYKEHKGKINIAGKLLGLLGKDNMPTLSAMFNEGAPWLGMSEEDTKRLRIPMTSYYAGEGIKDKWIAPPTHYRSMLEDLNKARLQSEKSGNEV